MGEQKGPNNTRWFLSMESPNVLKGSRFGPGNAGVATWLPFSVTYLI
jgi:hypothetical protein